MCHPWLPCPEEEELLVSITTVVAKATSEGKGKMKKLLN